jgi:hypothetical protein
MKKREKRDLAEKRQILGIHNVPRIFATNSLPFPYMWGHMKNEKNKK